mmetsp:Transcript_32189/g.68528  ORF Transcript_32189/g.68528 Transcript_32189/m.68528 type:complete len:422 (-) Transcript_32189:8-1273(-)
MEEQARHRELLHRAAPRRASPASQVNLILVLFQVFPVNAIAHRRNAVFLELIVLYVLFLNRDGRLGKLDVDPRQGPLLLRLQFRLRRQDDALPARPDAVVRLPHDADPLRPLVESFVRVNFAFYVIFDARPVKGINVIQESKVGTSPHHLRDEILPFQVRFFVLKGLADFLVIRVHPSLETVNARFDGQRHGNRIGNDIRALEDGPELQDGHVASRTRRRGVREFLDALPIEVHVVSRRERQDQLLALRALEPLRKRVPKDEGEILPKHRLDLDAARDPLHVLRIVEQEFVLLGVVHHDRDHVAEQFRGLDYVLDGVRRQRTGACGGGFLRLLDGDGRGGGFRALAVHRFVLLEPRGNVQILVIFLGELLHQQPAQSSVLVVLAARDAAPRRRLQRPSADSSLGCARAVPGEIGQQHYGNA